jgi:hypothetical protein
MDAVTVVIPACGEGEGLVAAVRALRPGPTLEVIVAAHGESAATEARVRSAGARWVACTQPCRGAQLAAGAAMARHAVLLFLHADCRLPDDAPALASVLLARPGVRGVGFRIAYDHPHPLLSLLAVASSAPWSWTYFGDQGFACRREDYRSLGGHAPIALFEDVDLARRLAQRGRLVRARARVRASSRRFVRDGVARRLAANILLCLRYWAGADPRDLAARYTR